MILTTGRWADGRTFIIFDAYESGRLVRTCWTPTAAEEKMLRQILLAVAS